MKFPMRRLVSMALLTSAVVLFGIFHFLPYVSDYESIGWSFWTDLIVVLQDPSVFEDVLVSMAVASFLMSSLLIPAAPFLITILNKSKVVWTMALASSGLATAGLWITAASGNEFDKLLPGGWCLMFAPVLNFFGLLISRENLPPPSSLPADSQCL